MKQFIILTFCILGFFSIEASAQLRPSQSQYLETVGAFTNPSFEQGYKGWTTTGCTRSLESDIPYLNKTLKLTCASETVSIKQLITNLTPFAESHGQANCTIKASAAGVKVRVSKNGIIENTSEEIGTTYKPIRLESYVGDTNNEIEIFADSYTGDIYIDDCSYKPVATNIFQGQLNPVSDYSDVDSPQIQSGVTLGNGTHTEKIAIVGDTIHVSGIIALGSTSSITGDIRINIPNNYTMKTHFQDGSNPLGIATYLDNGNEQLSAWVKPNDNPTELIIRYWAATGGTAGNVARSSVAGGASPFTWTNGDKILYKYSVPVDQLVSPNNVVAQNKALVQIVANSLTGETSTASFAYNKVTSVVEVEDNYNALNDNGDIEFTVPHDSLYHFNYGFSITHNSVTSAHDYACGLQINGSDKRQEIQKFGTSTVIYPHCDFKIKLLKGDVVTFFYRKQTSGTTVSWGTNERFNFLVIKEEPKSSVILGTFENINSTDLIEFRAEKSGTQTIGTASNITVVYDVVTKDNYSAYNNSTGVFVSPRETTYLICAGVFGASASYPIATYWQVQISMSISGDDRYLNRQTSGSTSTHQPYAKGCAVVSSFAGEEIKILVRHTAGSNRSIHANADFNYFSISELPDYQAIVRNLSNTTARCQTKYLSADVTSDTVDISDLRFDNLVIGERYQIMMTGAMQIGAGDATGTFVGFNSGTYITAVQGGNTAASNISFKASETRKFTATGTNVTFNTSSFSGATLLRGNGSTETYVTLCTDNSVETTEF